MFKYYIKIRRDTYSFLYHNYYDLEVRKRLEKNLLYLYKIDQVYYKIWYRPSKILNPFHALGISRRGTPNMGSTCIHHVRPTPTRDLNPQISSESTTRLWDFFLIYQFILYCKSNIYCTLFLNIDSFFILCYRENFSCIFPIYIYS